MLIGEETGRRALTGKQMTSWKDKWTIKRTDERCDGCVTMSVLAWCANY